MTKYRKKPIEIEAWRFGGPDMPGWLVAAMEAGTVMWHKGTRDSSPCYTIMTLEGTMRADPGDWIIKGVAGEIYPCKPDIFDKTYEKVAS